MDCLGELCDTAEAMTNRSVLFCWSLMFLCSLPLQCQSIPQWRSCPAMAKLPADGKVDEPPERRLWFELRQCPGESIIVNGYGRRESRPSLSFETGGDYPRQLVHILNVLVFETVGGSSYHVYVFVFHDGKPRLALESSADDATQVKEDEKDNVVVLKFPPKVHPGPDGKFPSVPDKVYKFPVEF